jgi:O-antigen ligase
MAADILNLATFMRAGDEHRLELGLGDAMARLMARIFHLLYTFLRPLLGATDTARLPRSTWCFALLFVYFLCSQILTNATAIYNIGYYGLVLPSFLYAAIKHPSRIRQIPCSVGAVGIAVFLVFVALHAVIGQFPDQSLSKTLLGALFTGIFVLMSMSFFNARDIDSLALLRCFLLTVIVMAPISYVLFRIHPTTYSLLPIGRAHNPIPIGNLYAMAALIATWLFFQPRTSMRWKLTALYGIATVILTILATTQRGPLLALFVGGAAGLLIMRQWKWLALGGGLALILGADFYYYTTHGHSLLQLDTAHAAITFYFTQRDSLRLDIWQQALAYIAERPWLGYGMQAKFYLEGVPGAVNPHNVFISTLYYTGIVGLGLLLLPLIAAFTFALRAWRSPYHQLCLMLLVHAVVATSTNYGQVANAAAPLWTIYWMPIAMALARAPTRQASTPPALG